MTTGNRDWAAIKPTAKPSAKLKKSKREQQEDEDYDPVSEAFRQGQRAKKRTRAAGGTFLYGGLNAAAVASLKQTKPANDENATTTQTAELSQVAATNLSRSMNLAPPSRGSRAIRNPISLSVQVAACEATPAVSATFPPRTALQSQRMHVSYLLRW